MVSKSGKSSKKAKDKKAAKKIISDLKKEKPGLTGDELVDVVADMMGKIPERIWLILMCAVLSAVIHGRVWPKTIDWIKSIALVITVPQAIQSGSYLSNTYAIGILWWFMMSGGNLKGEISDQIADDLAYYNNEFKKQCEARGGTWTPPSQTTGDFDLSDMTGYFGSCELPNGVITYFGITKDACSALGGRYEPGAFKVPSRCTVLPPEAPPLPDVIVGEK